MPEVGFQTAARAIPVLSFLLVTCLAADPAPAQDPAEFRIRTYLGGVGSEAFGVALSGACEEGLKVLQQDAIVSEGVVQTYRLSDGEVVSETRLQGSGPVFVKGMVFDGTRRVLTTFGEVDGTLEGVETDGVDIFVERQTCAGERAMLKIIKKPGDQRVAGVAAGEAGQSGPMIDEDDDLYFFGSSQTSGGDRDSYIAQVDGETLELESDWILPNPGDDDITAASRQTVGDATYLITATRMPDVAGGTGTDIEIHVRDGDDPSVVLDAMSWTGGRFDRVPSLSGFGGSVRYLVAAQGGQTASIDGQLTGSFEGGNDYIYGSFRIDTGAITDLFGAYGLRSDRQSGVFNHSLSPLVNLISELRDNSSAITYVYDSFDRIIHEEVMDNAGGFSYVEDYRGQVHAIGTTGPGKDTSDNAWLSESQSQFGGQAFYASFPSPLALEMFVNPTDAAVDVSIMNGIEIHPSKELGPGSATPTIPVPTTKPYTVVSGASQVFVDLDMVKSNDLHVNVATGVGMRRIDLPAEEYRQEATGHCTESNAILVNSTEEEVTVTDETGDAKALAALSTMIASLSENYSASPTALLGTEEVFFSMPVPASEEEWNCFAFLAILSEPGNAGKQSAAPLSLDVFDLAGNAIEVPFTATSVDSGVELPRRVTLHGNYPNPFNPSTTIRYELASGGSVSLTIRDIHGRIVRTLVRRESARGEYKVEWDGRDGGARASASGTYFARLEAGGQVSTIPLVLSK